MRRPSKIAVIIAGFTALDAAAAYALGARTVAVVLILTGCAGVPLLWHVPLCDDNGTDIEAIIDATRETIPDHVPDEWVKHL